MGGYATRVQFIHRKQGGQWYINFPAALARSMGFHQGETVEWFVESKQELTLRRPEAPLPALKKTAADSSDISSSSGSGAPPPSGSSASSSGRRRSR